MDATLNGAAKKNARKKTIRLPGPGKAAIALLGRITNAGMLTARRTYPREWRYYLAGVEINGGSVTALIHAGMISAGSTKSTDDGLVYHVTPLGTARLKHEPQSDIPNQLDWVGE